MNTNWDNFTLRPLAIQIIINVIKQGGNSSGTTAELLSNQPSLDDFPSKENSVHVKCIFCTYVFLQT